MDRTKIWIDNCLEVFFRWIQVRNKRTQSRIFCLIFFVMLWAKSNFSFFQLESFFFLNWQQRKKSNQKQQMLRSLTHCRAKNMGCRAHIASAVCELEFVLFFLLFYRYKLYLFFPCFFLSLTLLIKFSIAVFAWSIKRWPWTVFWFIDCDVSSTKQRSGILLIYLEILDVSSGS